MVDSLGTTAYSFDAAGQLLTEAGPFASDTVASPVRKAQSTETDLGAPTPESGHLGVPVGFPSHGASTYANRRRVALSLQQPTGSWTNGFNWDSSGRMSAVISPAGEFDYTYATIDPTFSGSLVREISLPGGAAITNGFDSNARLLKTALNNSGASTVDSAIYGYNAGNQRTAYTNVSGAYYHYSYDGIGQLTVATSSTASESRGYLYDAAWNLEHRTNNGVLSTFIVDNKNELTNSFGAANGYDANGNLTSGTNGHVVYAYDDENRLKQWIWYATDSAHCSDGALRTDFTYDGIGRLRKRVEYVITGGVGGGGAGAGAEGLLPPSGGGCSWGTGAETRYIYDGMRVIQERDGSNNPEVAYTRGKDLSGSLEGAGGIGGLLARSTWSGSSWNSHALYHADGNGNVTKLIDSGSEAAVATYRYDPFGNTLSSSGSLADANVYRFSSKEVHVASGMYYYLYRFYDPSAQRWPNRDPLAYGALRRTPSLSIRGFRPHEAFDGGNLYWFVNNDPTVSFDPLGLEAGFTYGPGGSMHHPIMDDDPGLSQAASWLKKCHPELADCGWPPISGALPGLLGAYGFQLGPVSVIQSGLNSGDAVATLAHERMHCREGLATGAYHGQMELDAQFIRLQYYGDPEGKTCHCDGNHVGSGSDMRSFPPGYPIAHD